jgi:hypothetical protein
MSQRTCLLVKGTHAWVYKQALIVHCNHLIYSYTLLFNIFTIHKWIIAYCPIYIGYLHSEPAWFTTVVSELRF